MPRTIFLQIAYVANIIVLLPVCYGLMFGSGVGGVFEGKVDESQGLRLLVGALYAAILLASVAGLFAPLFFAPVLLIQIVYKSIWLLVFILPLYRTAGSAAVPWGISGTFITIVATYPLLLWLGTRPG